MAVPDRLPVSDWMAASATRAVIEALQAHGGPGAARFVGGAVRNAILGKPIGDVDIATPLVPEAVIQALKAAKLKFVPTGIEHGTVTAIAEGRPFEVTTLRRDVETDGRRAVVAFTTDWSEDAQRRDFRLNALYMDPQGRLYDPVGCGVEDCLAGRIVFVGDAEIRIREDYLRILRFFRFNAWYGRGAVDEAGLKACADLKAGLAQLSAERVSKELLKLLAADDPAYVVDLMLQTGVLEAVLPGNTGAMPFGGLVRLQREVLDETDAELRLAALLPADSKIAAAQADRLRLSKAQRIRLAAAAGRDPVTLAAIGEREAKQLIYGWGAAVFRDRLKLVWAADPWTDAQRWQALLAVADAWTEPKFPLSGQDAAAAGFKPGQAMGRALRDTEAWWVEQDFAPDRDQLFSHLRAQV